MDNEAIGQFFAPYCVFALYRPGGCHGHLFRHKKTSCSIVKLLSNASIKKAQNGPSTQLIETTSCTERSDATIGDEDLSYFSSYQTLSGYKK